MRKQGSITVEAACVMAVVLFSLAALIGNAGRIHDETVSAMVLHEAVEKCCHEKKINVRDVEQFFKEHRGLRLRFTTFGISIQEKGEKRTGRATGENWGKQIENDSIPAGDIFAENYSDSRGRQMKIEYMREMKRSYMTVKMEREETAESYETGMLAKNQIPGLLRMKIKYTDGSPVYCYDITSRQPVSRLFESQPADEGQVRSFFRQLYETLDRMEAYLLGDGGILLDPELIYVDPEGFKIGLCVIPGGKEEFNSQLSLFIQYLMKHIDHKDRECVVLTYGLYQACMKDNYSLEDLMGILAEKMPEQRDAEENEKDIRTVKTETASQDFRERYGNIREWDNEERHNETEKTEMKEPSETPETFSESNGWRLIKKLIVLLVFLAAAFGGTWFLYGADVLTAFWIYGAAAGGILAVIIILSHFILEKTGKNKKFKPAETEEEDPWRIFYEEPEKQEKIDDIYSYKETEHRIRPGSAAAAEGWQSAEKTKTVEEFQTILLTAKEEPGHTLVSALPENKDIPVEYVPFVIGKHGGLADYILDKPTVSRFHVRITEKSGDYFLTDLNSTNGTKVNGRLLAANEETILKEGDEVQIAEEKYFWK